MNLILIFMSITKKKYKLMEMDANIDYSELMFIFLKIFYLQKFMKKKTCWQKPYFWREKKKSIRKKSGCKFIRISTSKKGDAGYKIGRIQTFISKLTDN